MFTPHNVSAGPDKSVMLNKIRITRGKYVGTGKEFQVIDDYSISASAHKILNNAWVGTTEFREVDQQVIVDRGVNFDRGVIADSGEDVQGIVNVQELVNKSISWADIASDEEVSAGAPAPAICSLTARPRFPEHILVSCDPGRGAARTAFECRDFSFASLPTLSPETLSVLCEGECKAGTVYVGRAAHFLDGHPGGCDLTMGTNREMLRDQTGRPRGLSCLAQGETVAKQSASRSPLAYARGCAFFVCVYHCCMVAQRLV